MLRRTSICQERHKEVVGGQAAGNEIVCGCGCVLQVATLDEQLI